MKARPLAELVASLNALADAWGERFALRTRDPPTGDGVVVGVKINDGATSPWRDLGAFAPADDARALVDMWRAAKEGIDDPTDTIDVPGPTQSGAGWADGSRPGLATGRSNPSVGLVVERFFFEAGAPTKEVLERWVLRALGGLVVEVTAEVAVRHVELHVLGAEGVKAELERVVGALGGKTLVAG